MGSDRVWERQYEPRQTYRDVFAQKAASLLLRAAKKAIAGDADAAHALKTAIRFSERGGIEAYDDVQRKIARAARKENDAGWHGHE